MGRWYCSGYRVAGSVITCLIQVIIIETENLNTIYFGAVVLVKNSKAYRISKIIDPSYLNFCNIQFGPVLKIPDQFSSPAGPDEINILIFNNFLF